MGVICPLSPERRAINTKNIAILRLIKEKLKGREHYEFTHSVEEAMQRMQSKYLCTEAILEDIQKLHSLKKQTIPKKSINGSDSMEDQLRNSCLILENQASGKEGQDKQTSFLNSESFLNNKMNNESLVEQIGVLYKRQIKMSDYSQALYVFLKWANMFEEHISQGFLRPLYMQFYLDISKKKSSNFEVIIQEVQMFVTFLAQIITEVYGLKLLATRETGKLIKNDNVFNTIMSCIFKKTKLRRFVLKCIRQRDSQKIQKYEQQLVRLAKKPIHFFGVSSKFVLLQDSSMTTSDYSKTAQNAPNDVHPYSQSLKLLDELCQKGSPVTKLKTIIAIAKQIDQDIRVFYASKKRESPELDPDNLASILTYLLVKNGRKQVYQELKVAENFSTQNSLNCVSGLYLAHFNSAIEEIIRMDSSD